MVSSRTTEKIVKAMDELHYQPSQIARSLVKKRTNTIGVIIPNIKNTFFNSWFRYIEDYATTLDFNLLLCNTDEDPAKEIRYVKLLQSQRVDGVLIAPCSSASVEYLQKCKANFVIVDRVVENINAPCVTTDHYRGSFEATKYLIGLGHKKIAVLKGAGILYPDKERYAGFKNAMDEKKIEIEEEFIFNCEFNEKIAYETVLNIFRKGIEPTAIFAFNSLMAIGAVRALQQMNISIPKKVSLLSFDEIPGGEIVKPSITHVMQPIKSLGKNSITLLIDMIQSSNFVLRSKPIFIKATLVINDSCRKI